MKTLRICLAQAVCGAALGLLFAATLASIAMPDFSKVALPVSAALDIERLSRLSRLAHLDSLTRGPLFSLVGLLVLCASWCLTARSLNPGLPPWPYRQAPRPLLAWTAVLGSGAAAVLTAAWSFAVGNQAEISAAAWASALVLASAGGAAAWMTVSPSGWAGDLTAWRKPWAPLRRAALSTAAAGAVWGAVLYLGAQSVSRLLQFLYGLNVEVWNPGFEISYAGAVTTFVLPIVLLGLAFPAAWSLAAALAADGAPKSERLRRAAPALALAALTGAAALGLHLGAVRAHDWDAGSLLEAAALPDRAAPAMTSVTLGFDRAPLVMVKPWEATARYYSWTVSGEAPATEANAQALVKFLSGPGWKSRFRNASLEAVASIHATLWEPEPAFRSLLELGPVYETPLLVSLLERAWLASSAPLTPENRARLELLCDPGRYRIGSRSALALSRAWLRFGDLPRARAWLKAARSGGLSAADLGTYSVPAQAPLADGVVKGRILVRGRGQGRIKVGLFRLQDSAKAAEAPSHGVGVLARLTASQWAGRDGSFEFRRVGAGRYSLSFLLPEAVLAQAPERLEASPHPGIISLDRSRPRFDAGAISLLAR